MIADAYREMRAALPDMTVTVLHIPSGRTASCLRSSNAADPTATTSGAVDGVRLRFRLLVADMGGAEWKGGDKVSLRDNDADQTFRIVNTRKDPSGATMLVECGDQYG